MIEMKQYRKLPVVIEAFQLGGDTDAVDLMQMGFEITLDGEVIIPTLEGRMIAKAGDWIIKGMAGEYYPCKDYIFKNTYEEVP